MDFKKHPRGQPLLAQLIQSGTYPIRIIIIIIYIIVINVYCNEKIDFYNS